MFPFLIIWRKNEWRTGVKIAFLRGTVFFYFTDIESGNSDNGKRLRKFFKNIWIDSSPSEKMFESVKSKRIFIIIRKVFP